MLDLTPEQSAAVQAPGPVCLTASAGSGKTTVLVERYLRELKRGASPDEILTVTFTRKAAMQLRERIQQQLLDSPGLYTKVLTTPWIGTLHSFCLQVVRQWGALLGPELVGEIVDPFDRADLVADTTQEWLAQLEPSTLQHLYSKWLPQDLVSIAEQILQKPHSFQRALFPDTVLSAALELLLQTWRRQLRDRQLRTFDDLEQDAEQILTSFSEARSFYRKLFKAVLVDEFQDTSQTQWRIVEALMADSPQKLFVVGDPKQSIYRFRDADVSLFLEWNKQIESRGGNSLELRTCFRSGADLVELINGLAGTLFENSALADRPMVAGRAAGASCLEVHDYGGDSSEAWSRNEQEQVATAVGRLLQNGVPPYEIALLFRNADRMQAFASVLLKNGVPVTCETVVSLFSLYDVQDIAAFLRAVVSPQDDFRIAAFLHTPGLGLAVGDLHRLCSDRGESLFAKLRQTGTLPWFTGLIEKGESHTQTLLQQWFLHSDFRPAGNHLNALLVGLVKWPSVKEAVKEMEAWEKQGVQTTTTFGANQNGVRLMTVHASKGLEFSEVFLVDTLRRTPTRLPWLAWQEGEEIGYRFRHEGEILATPVFERLAAENRQKDQEEFRRILYVALTRSKDRLHFCLPQDKSKIPSGSWAEMLDGFVKLRRGNPEPRFRGQQTFDVAPPTIPGFPSLLGEDL